MRPASPSGVPAFGRKADSYRNNRATILTASKARAIQTITITTAPHPVYGPVLGIARLFATLGEDVGWDHFYGQRDAERDDDEVVQVSEDGDHVGDEVYGAEGVPDDGGGADPRVPGHPRVPVGEIERVHLDLEPARPRLEPPDEPHRQALDARNASLMNCLVPSGPFTRNRISPPPGWKSSSKRKNGHQERSATTNSTRRLAQPASPGNANP